MAPHGYVAQLEGDTLTWCRVRKQGGFLGMGKREVGEPVLLITRRGDRFEVPAESADAEFVALLASKLKEQ